MSDTFSVLLIDSDPAAARAFVEALQGLEPQAVVRIASSLRGAREQLRAHGCACIVTELHLPDASGSDVVRALRFASAARSTPIVIWTTGVDDEAAAATIALGANAYLRKDPASLGRLIARVRSAAGAAWYTAAPLPVHDLGETCADADPIIGTTAVMRRVLAMIDRAAGSAVPVLIEGETGTGKELLARAVHTRGTRRSAPFLTQNCAALTDTLLESELFGHVRGAFTGAERDRRGLFIEAGHGTVFLDEIGETPPSVQAKLLRVMQEREVKAVGADRPTPVHARVVAATNRALEREVQDGRFRADLYFRLAVFPITVPPLRERRTDIPALTDRFRRAAELHERRHTGGFTTDALQSLCAYAWPGNVRELEHEVQRLVLSIEPGQRIQFHHLAARIRAATPSSDEPLGRILDRVELAILQQRLDRLGSKTAAARSLGITREALYAKLRRGSAAG